MRPLADINELHEAQSRRVFSCSLAFIIVLVIGYAGIAARVVQLKTAPDERLQGAAGEVVSHRTEFSRRGDLCDRRGRIIAASSLAYRLYVDPQTVADLDTIAVRLAKVLDREPIAIDREIQSRTDRRYVVIDHLLDDWEVAAVRAADLAGVGLAPRLVREYPHGELAAGVVGTVGFEHQGMGGFELRHEERLAARDGELTYLRDSRRRALWIDPDDYQPGRAGEDLRLSIDLVVQAYAEERLATVVERVNAGGGRLVVLDSRSGDILAMCDILREREGWDEYTTDEARLEHPSLGRNRNVTDPYEPGSTFKPFVWATATSLGRADPAEMLPTPTAAEGAYRTSFGRSIRDSHYAGPVTWEEVLVRSLNSGMAMIAMRLKHQEMREAIQRFGFGRATRCGLPGESIGIIQTEKDWSNYTQTSVSFGHEICVTPVQMVRAFSVFARDGTMPSVRLVARDPDDLEYRFIHQVLSEEVARKTRDALRRVVTEGTGRRAQSTKYRMFGKSGTPQLPKKEGGGYHERRYMPNFIAGAPLEDPRIVVLCVIDDPDRSIAHWGGTTAGPVVRDVIDHTLTYLGVPPDVSEEEAEEALTWRLPDDPVEPTDG